MTMTIGTKELFRVKFIHVVKGTCFLNDDGEYCMKIAESTIMDNRAVVLSGPRAGFLNYLEDASEVHPVKLNAYVE
jgi:hypothetical protein